MANSDNLSRPTGLGGGDALTSSVAVAFLRTFIFPEKFGELVPEVNWNSSQVEIKEQLEQLSGKPYADLYRKEMITKVRIYQSVGQVAEASALMKKYSSLFSKPLPADLVKLPIVAQLVEVADSEDKTVAFSLPQSQQVRIFAIGEADSGRMYDYGWIENSDSGMVVWEMQEAKTVPAGGAAKNRQVDALITLPAGNYKLRYKSDDSHSFDRWNELPPDINYWGITVYKQ